MKPPDSDHRARSPARRSRAPERASPPLTAEEIRQRARHLLADCERASARDPRIGAITEVLIEETRCLAEAVLALMPDDSAALTDLLTQAHRMLVSLVEAVERGDAPARPASSSRSVHPPGGATARQRP